MKTVLLGSLAALLLWPASGLAQNTSLIKERARNAANPNSPPRQTPPPARPGAAHAPGAAQQLAPAQQQSIQKIVADLAVIKTKPEASAEQKQQLARNLTACVQSSNKPSPETINLLAENLAAAVAGKKLTAPAQAQLGRDLFACLNSGAGNPQPAMASIHSTLRTNGASKEEADSVIAHLRSITGELSAKAAKK